MAEKIANVIADCISPYVSFNAGLSCYYYVFIDTLSVVTLTKHWKYLLDIYVVSLSETNEQPLPLPTG